MKLEREQLCDLIPHHGNMCLLDSVIEWDQQHIRCRSTSQQQLDNPLREHDVLDAIAGVEYAAQAMAVHGALLQGDSAPPQAAYLAALRGIQLHSETLHQEAELLIDCQRLGGDSNGFIYQFEIGNGTTVLLQGRATVLNSNTQTVGSSTP